MYSPAQVRVLLDDLAVATSLEGAEERADLLAAINELPLNQRALVALLVYGYTGTEIAGKLQVSNPTVTRLTKQTLRQLTERMNRC